MRNEAHKTLWAALFLVEALAPTGHSQPLALGTRNVKDYGCVGDGVANDLDCFKAAVAGTPPQGTLYVPVGRYHWVGAGTELLLIPYPIRLICEGWGAQIVVDSGVGAVTDVIRIKGSLSYHTGMEISGCSIVPARGTPGRYGLLVDTTSDTNGSNCLSNSRFSHNHIGPFGKQAFATRFPNFNDGFFTSAIDSNLLIGGILLDRAGDSIRIEDNSITGSGKCITAALTKGASSLVISKNNLTCSDGLIAIHAGNRISILYNDLEPLQNETVTHSEAMVDVDGTPADAVRAVEIAGNSFSATPHRVEEVIRLGHARNTSIHDNSFVLGDPSQRFVDLTPNAFDTYIGPNIYNPDMATRSNWVDNGRNTLTATVRSGSLVYSSGGRDRVALGVSGISAAHFAGMSETPRALPGQGAGEGGVVSNRGNDVDGQITVASGERPLPNSIVASVTFSRPMSPSAPICLKDASNAAAASLSGNTQVFLTVTEKQLSIKANSVGLAPRTVYTWTYHCME